MAEQLSVDEVVRHLTTSDGDNFTADDQYVAADTERRAQIRAAVAKVVTDLLVDGADGDLGNGAIAAENICNTMWHLAGVADQEDELACTQGADA
ncbi:hypothetical protein [Embleya scabrispora]|uniref:hypothetical protein n=1 Tax=Embleya scabrispora TaxID=159449 RepID=UPI0003AB48F4|nr:hypothetical protein [Embleya scabrispora]MYS80167.1 hypothetical protein [Streptomyces sp. SID5474]